MYCWLLFHRELSRDVPEAAEVMRFQQVAAENGIRLDVLNPRHFELIVDSREGWSAVYQGRRLAKPDLIIPRTGSETTYFTLAVLRHFERQGIAMVNSSSAVEAVADKLQTLQILSGAGIPIPKNARTGCRSRREVYGVAAFGFGDATGLSGPAGLVVAGWVVAGVTPGLAPGVVAGGAVSSGRGPW